MKTVCIVQARMGSKRFPGKVLQDLHGYPVLEHVLARCTMIQGIDDVVLAVPDEMASDELEAVADKLEIPTFRGPEDDVLKRYALAAKQYKADVIMRITSDCPLIDPWAAALVLAPVKAGECEYCSNVHPRTYEKGLDAEAFTRWALTVADRDAGKKRDREHVTPYIIDHPSFRQVNVSSPIKRDPNINFSVDTKEDLERVSAEFLRRYPDWSKKNDSVPAGSHST